MTYFLNSCFTESLEFLHASIIFDGELKKHNSNHSKSQLLFLQQIFTVKGEGTDHWSVISAAAIVAPTAAAVVTTAVTTTTTAATATTALQEV